MHHPGVNLEPGPGGKEGSPGKRGGNGSSYHLKVLQAEFISQRGICVGLDYAQVPTRALGESPWVCLSVRAFVHSQGKGKASRVLLVAKFQSILSWEELCGASLLQVRREGLLIS